MKQKIVLEFESAAEIGVWAAEFLNTPSAFANSLVGDPDDFKKTNTKDTKKEKAAEVEKPAAPAAENGGVSKLLVDLKEAGIQLADFKPESRYAGVETALAWFGVTKIKDLKEEDQPKVLKMFNKMLKADKAGYNELLESLKQ